MLPNLLFQSWLACHKRLPFTKDRGCMPFGFLDSLQSALYTIGDDAVLLELN